MVLYIKTNKEKNMKNSRSLKIHKKDSIEIALEKNTTLLDIIRKLEKTNKKLKSQYKTMETVWHKTEKKYKDIVSSNSLEEIIDYIDNKKPLKKECLSRICKNCDSKSLREIQFNGFCIVICDNCSHRNRVDDKITI